MLLSLYSCNMFTLDVFAIYCRSIHFSVITDDVLGVKCSALVVFEHRITEIISQSQCGWYCAAFPVH